ncbi:MAG: hypothetical protein IPG39_20830 [Bacteroidetes bacterium]|nr:hypothetical protein [Bacteroidota bacterium]
MKKLSITLIAGLIFISPQIFAQIIQSAPQGNLIWFSPETASIENGFVSRKGAADKEFRKIGETTIPSSADEIEKTKYPMARGFSSSGTAFHTGETGIAGDGKK